jgi:hypothetical protein
MSLENTFYMSQSVASVAVVASLIFGSAFRDSGASLMTRSAVVRDRDAYSDWLEALRSETTSPHLSERTDNPQADLASCVGSRRATHSGAGNLGDPLLSSNFRRQQPKDAVICDAIDVSVRIHRQAG